MRLVFVITMYFGGGLIPTYLLYTQLGLTETFTVYWLPTLFSAYYMILIASFIQGLPDSLAESARLDGASELMIYFKVILPLCKPVIAAIAVMLAVGHWNSWFDNHIYTRGAESLTTLQYLLYNYLNEAQRLADQIKNSVNGGDISQMMSNISSKGIRMTITVLASLPIFMIYPFMQKHFVKGIMVGAVKG